MLTQIICDKFLKQPLTFSDGLNCVLGDDCATNSIGKSSFLMIIDFVFGGDDYLNQVSPITLLPELEGK